MNSIEGGTYEIIQSRLAAQKKDLQDRLGCLDAERKKIFGSIESKLIANNRIITDNNCISSDMVAIGDFCIFGYNVHFGLRTEIKIEDVFSIVRYAAGEFKNLSLDVIRDDIFTLDFVNLYKYYRNTKFNNFFVRGNYLYMIFQLSTSVTDLKAFKWLIKDNTLTYIDNRSEHEYRFPNQHDFNWQYSTRDMYRYGKHSHVSILDKVFVDTINGDLAIKVENNTEKGQGILSEPVIHPDQTLDDGEYRFADLGNLIALAIKPFQEETRYFIYNHKLKEVEKIDSLKDTAILLPDNQGLIFSNGYYLQTGEHKVFEHRFANINFHERIASPNGEDFIYVFYEEKEGHYVLMSYNTISQEVKTPIICNGFSILKDGELCYFQSEDTQTKNHVVQIWQTPFIKGDIMPSQYKDTFIYKIGNKDIVRGMSDCHSIINLLNKEDNYEGLYSDLTHLSQNILDKYYWITHPETFELNIPLTDIKTTANVAIDEFEKVVELRRIAEELTHVIQEKLSTLFGKIKNSPLNNIDTFVHNLSELRSLRGELISLKEVRYIDPQFITQSESEIIEQTQKVSLYCVEFLLDDKAFAPYHQRVAEKQKELEKISKVVDGKRLVAEVNQITADLEMLIEIVSNLNIEDTSHSTAIIDAISLIFATLNQLKAGIKNKIASLGSQEANLDFVAQVKLIDQSIVSYLDMATSPEKVDELLNKIALQLEDLEARFSDHEQFIETIIEKREEIYAAFDNQKANLIENRNKKSIAIDSASQRILKGVRVKALTFGSVEEINAYFASDLMISKLGELMAQLHDLDDVGKAESIGTELKSAKEDALRRLKDKQDLYEDGENIIRLGKHKFAVNKQALDLTIVMKGDGLKYHLTGTDFYQDLHNDTLLESKKYWNQELVSENNLVYRSAYLAYVVFKSHPIQDLLIPSDDLQVLVQQQINKSYTEGYIKGVHDHDALLILKTLINKHHTLGMLRFSSRQRAFAQFFWYSLDAEEQRSINDKIKASGEVLAVFPNSKDYAYLITILEDKIKRFAKKNPLFTDRNLSVPIISRYLCEEFRNDDAFAVSIRANQLLDLFLKEMSNKGASVKFKYNLDHAPDLENKIQRTAPIFGYSAFYRCINNLHFSKTCNSISLRVIFSFRFI